MSDVYRGFKIEMVDGGYWVERDGQSWAAQTYDSACDLIDRIKREEFKAKVDAEDAKAPTNR